MDYLSILIEAKVSLCDLSAPEIEPSEVKLVVLNLNQAHQIVLLLCELVFEKAVELALFSDIVRSYLVWAKLMIRGGSFFNVDVNVDNPDLLVITHIQA